MGETVTGGDVSEQWPFPVSVTPWDKLPQADRRFFCFEDDYLPLHPNHAARIGLLAPKDAGRLVDWAYATIPRGWPERNPEPFGREDVCRVSGCWNDPARRAGVRRWLYNRRVPFHRTVYLGYANGEVVRTTWRILVRYWDAFAWSVGYAMVAFDHTLCWACCFHHEEVIIFGDRRAGDADALDDA